MANHNRQRKELGRLKSVRFTTGILPKLCVTQSRDLRNTTNKEEATTLFPKVSSMIDKLAKTNIIHKNKAANLKSSLAKHVESL